jgi:hypothetical protein
MNPIGMALVVALGGTWSGTVTFNQKETKAGGNPLPSETGTPLVMELRKSGEGLTGTIVTGKDQRETVALDEEIWSVDDGTITWRAERVAFEKIPTWVVGQLPIRSTDTFFAYRFKDCRVNKTGVSCVPGKEIPAGMEKSGLWVFKVDGSKMKLGVYYTYPSGVRRILEQELNRN